MKFQSQRRDRARITIDAPNNSGLRRGQVVFIVKAHLRDTAEESGYSVSADPFEAPNWYVADKYLEPLDE